MDMAGLFSSLPDIIALIPVMLYAVQIMFYLIMIWFLGSISMRGFKHHKPFLTGMFGLLITGSICLVAGLSFADFVPFFSQGIFEMMQVDLLIAGFLASILLAIALRQITHDSTVLSSDKIMEKLKRKVKILEEMLRKKAGHISEKEAKKIASEAFKDYKPEKAKLIGSEWEVELKRGDKKAKVILDAWDGEIKNKIRGESAFALFFKDFHKVTGLIIIIAIIAASLVFFEGFPDPADSFVSMFGITMDDITDLSDSMKGNPFIAGDLPQRCLSPLVLSRYSAQLQDKQFLLDHVYEDESTSGMIERNSGDTVKIMLRLDHGGKDLILGFTEGQQLCYLTDNIFCGCLETGY